MSLKAHNSDAQLLERWSRNCLRKNTGAINLTRFCGAWNGQRFLRIQDRIGRLRLVSDAAKQTTSSNYHLRRAPAPGYAEAKPQNRPARSGHGRCCDRCRDSGYFACAINNQSSVQSDELNGRSTTVGAAGSVGAAVHAKAFAEPNEQPCIAGTITRTNGRVRTRST